MLVMIIHLYRPTLEMLSIIEILNCIQQSIYIQTWMHPISTSSFVIFFCVRENSLYIMTQLCKQQLCARS